MILNFDVIDFVPFVPWDHKDISDHRLFVFNNENRNVMEIWSLQSPQDADIELYRVSEDGNIEFKSVVKFKVKEVKPAWTTSKEINGKFVDVIFE